MKAANLIFNNRCNGRTINEEVFICELQKWKGCSSP